MLAITSIAISMTACDGKYDVDSSHLSDENREKQETLLEEALELYKVADNPVGKANAAFNAGFHYMILGKNTKAIGYYEEVIAVDPVHYPALTNLSSIYEEAGEVDKALEYTTRLYDHDANKTTPEVIRDMVRLLTVNGKQEEARMVLKDYALTEAGQKDGLFIADQYSLIK